MKQINQPQAIPVIIYPLLQHIFDEDVIDNEDNEIEQSFDRFDQFIMINSDKI